MLIDLLPSLNALLNSTSAVLLVIGHRKLRQGFPLVHRRFMISAFSVSILFLISYIIYHISHGTTRFLGEGWIRPVYFTILISHTILAACVPPLAVITLRFGLKNRVEAHKKIARWAYPIWLYVSVTGVIVYLLLYQAYPQH